VANHSYQGLSFPDWKEVVGTSPVLRNPFFTVGAKHYEVPGSAPVVLAFVALRRFRSVAPFRKLLVSLPPGNLGCTKEGEARSISQRPSGRMSVSDGRAAPVRMVRQYTSPRSIMYRLISQGCSLLAVSFVRSESV